MLDDRGAAGLTALSAGEVHEGRNKGQVPVAVAVIFAEKGKPLTTQVR